MMDKVQAAVKEKEALNEKVLELNNHIIYLKNQKPPEPPLPPAKPVWKSIKQPC